jgi:hypothetical protein
LQKGVERRLFVRHMEKTEKRAYRFWISILVHASSMDRIGDKQKTLSVHNLNQLGTLDMT